MCLHVTMSVFRRIVKDDRSPLKCGSMLALKARYNCPCWRTCQAHTRRRGPGVESSSASSTLCQRSGWWGSLERRGIVAGPQQRAARAWRAGPEKASHLLRQLTAVFLRAERRTCGISTFSFDPCFFSGLLTVWWQSLFISLCHILLLLMSK